MVPIHDLCPARALLALGLFILPASVVAQTGSKAPRGVWEPVSYSEDLKLTDVFFVTPDVGWVAGDKGTILHTEDGGKSWEAQLGGDPAAADPEITRLRFYDERHGWAIKGGKLLATTDGGNWEEIAPILQRMGDFAFVSPADGFAAAGETQYMVEPHYIYRTRDGGRTWEQGARCEAKAVVDGLTKQIKCHFIRLHFPTPSVGYAIAQDICAGMGCGPPPIMAKTEDGGETWRFFVGPGGVKGAPLTDLFFTSEQSGFVTSSEGKLYNTWDGGNTWRGIVATPGEWLRFADPGTGWSLAGGHLAFSTNGGGRWSSRPHRFPATVNALSFPRRDRAYVVGAHGMIMRYRVVDPREPAAPSAIPAPAMPPFVNPLEGQAAEVVELVQSALPMEGGSTAAGGSAGSDEADESVAEEAEQAGEASAGSAIAPPKLKKLDLLITALGATLPSFLDQFANLNLLAARLRSAGALPARLSELRSALSAAGKAGDRAAANAALAQALTAAEALRTAAAVAAQRQLPPLEGGETRTEGTEVPAGGAVEPPEDES